MPEILAVVARQRARLLARDRATLAALGRDWRALSVAVEQMRAELEQRMLTALAQGQPIRPSWLHSAGRLDELAQQLESEVGRFTRTARPRIDGHVARAAELGSRSALTAASAAGVPGGELIAATLPTQAVERLAAATAHGAPVGRVLADMAPDAAAMLRQQLLQGVTLGEHPTTIARRMTRVADVPLARARTVARTEAMRAFRGANLATWRGVSSITGWVWVAGLDGRTCGACYSLHGSEHSMSEEFSGHVNCRCCPAPLVPGVQVIPEPGGVLLRRLDHGELSRLLGPAKAAALHSGRIIPADLVAHRTSPVWGVTRTEASMPQALANARRRRVAA